MPSFCCLIFLPKKSSLAKSGQRLFTRLSSFLYQEPLKAKVKYSHEPQLLLTSWSVNKSSWSLENRFNWLNVIFLSSRCLTWFICGLLRCYTGVFKCFLSHQTQAHALKKGKVSLGVDVNVNLSVVVSPCFEVYSFSGFFFRQGSSNYS